VRLPRALVIGAYGGEHIGDAAILGGVLFRMHRRFGTSAAVLMSQRPQHTRHLIPMLDLPVAIRVEEYVQRNVPALLADCDVVVFAGGPLMDLPKQLVKHLYTVALARQKGIPFVIEGIGVGPFVRRPSEWTARLIARMAGRITVRTSADADTELVRGLAVEIGRDPAFDYLETRPPALTRWPAAERRWLAALRHDVGERPLIALNIRPIRHDYTEGAPAGTREAFTRTVENRCEEQLAAALVRFHDASAVAPCFVFFPMNAIQFGQSDLRSAWRILRHLPPRVDYRIWEYDATIDGVIALLRAADVAVCMRFHAAIYALAQQVPVVGIDYRIGRKDKVGALLDDFGTGGNCRRIDELTAEWLYERLCALSAAPGTAAGGTGGG
jgi:polysaccharide pyruvyl transferase WcaK-like protein